MQLCGGTQEADSGVILCAGHLCIAAESRRLPGEGMPIIGGDGLFQHTTAYIGEGEGPEILLPSRDPTFAQRCTITSEGAPSSGPSTDPAVLGSVCSSRD